MRAEKGSSGYGPGAWIGKERVGFGLFLVGLRKGKERASNELSFP